MSVYQNDTDEELAEMLRVASSEVDYYTRCLDAAYPPSLQKRFAKKRSEWVLSVLKIEAEIQRRKERA